MLYYYHSHPLLKVTALMITICIFSIPLPIFNKSRTNLQCDFLELAKHEDACGKSESGHRACDLEYDKENL